MTNMVVRRRSLLTALGGVLLLSALTAASASSQAADTSTGQWTSVDLGPRIDFGVGSVGTHVLIAGGYTSDGSGNFTYSDRVDMYDSTTGAWSAASLSEARSDPVLVSVGPQVLIAVVRPFRQPRKPWTSTTASVTVGPLRVCPRCLARTYARPRLEHGHSSWTHRPRILTSTTVPLVAGAR